LSEERCDLLCLDLPRAEELRLGRPSQNAIDSAVRRARALGDTTRLTLAIAMRDGDELCVCDLAWIIERPQNLVSHHLRALRHAGLARSRRDGKMVKYQLTAEGEVLLAAVVGTKVAVA